MDYTHCWLLTTDTIRRLIKKRKEKLQKLEDENKAYTEVFAREICKDQVLEVVLNRRDRYANDLRRTQSRDEINKLWAKIEWNDTLIKRYLSYFNPKLEICASDDINGHIPMCHPCLLELLKTTRDNQNISTDTKVDNVIDVQPNFHKLQMEMIAAHIDVIADEIGRF